jgi:hypothetical protein
MPCPRDLLAARCRSLRSRKSRRFRDSPKRSAAMASRDQSRPEDRGCCRRQSRRPEPIVAAGQRWAWYWRVMIAVQSEPAWRAGGRSAHDPRRRRGRRGAARCARRSARRRERAAQRDPRAVRLRQETLPATAGSGRMDRRRFGRADLREERHHRVVPPNHDAQARLANGGSRYGYSSWLPWTRELLRRSGRGAWRHRFCQ